MVRLLIEAGADLSLKDNDGTALDNAKMQGHTDIVTLLEQAEAKTLNKPANKKPCKQEKDRQQHMSNFRKFALSRKGMHK